MKKAVIALLCLSFAVCFYGCKGEEKPEVTTKAATTAFNFDNVDNGNLELNEESATGEKITQKDGSFDVHYDSDAKVETVCQYDKDGKVTKYSQYIRNDDKKPITVKNFDENKAFLSATQYDYNQDGTVNRIYYYDKNGVMDYYEEDYYDADGNRTGKLFDADGTLLADPYATTTKKAESKTEKTTKK